MSALNDRLARKWVSLGTRFMPFADVATVDLPLSRLLRLSLFQVSVGIAVVLLIGTLNRVMIVELGVPAWLVALMVSLPLVFAPLRAVVGFRSDTHRSVLGWRRVPYIWMGTLLQFGGLAIMPFALLVLSGDTHGPVVIGQAGAALAFLLVGAGLHTTQTVGLALATDLAPPEKQARVVILMCGMMLVGMVLSALAFGVFLADFSEVRLIQVIQGAGLATMGLNLLALWKQEARDPSRTRRDTPRPAFRDSWRQLDAGRSYRRFIAVGLGTVAFSMQDVLLEPYGGQVLHLPVSATTSLTALLAVGGICGFAISAKLLARALDPYRLAALGALTGLVAFACVIAAAPFASPVLFGIGTSLIGFGAALFLVGTLTAAMELAPGGHTGLALGAWGAVQASAAGCAIASGGLIRDAVGSLAATGALGETLTGPATGYGAVYQIEMVLLFATLIALGPLVRPATERVGRVRAPFLADYPSAPRMQH
jgi:BCD family chlorophyll transporter-like MFS transporter